MVFPPGCYGVTCWLDRVPRFPVSFCCVDFKADICSSFAAEFGLKTW